MTFSNDDLGAMNKILGEEEEVEETVKPISLSEERFAFMRNDARIEQTSQFYYADAEDNILGRYEVAPSVEHAFQASKTINQDLQDLALQTDTVAKAQKVGKGLVPPDGWEDKRVLLMERLIHDKFNQNFSWKLRLLTTGNAAITNESKDTFWGVNEDGEGENQLGKVIMHVRDEIFENEGSFQEILGHMLEKNKLGFVMKWIDFEKAHL